RMLAKVAYTRLNVELAVGPDRHEPVVSDRPGSVRSDRHTKAAHLGADALPGACFPLVPLEQLDAAVECLLHERARHMSALSVGSRRAVRRLAFGRVDAADRNLIEPELPGRLRDNRLHDRVGLHWTGRALLRAGRCSG